MENCLQYSFQVHYGEGKVRFRFSRHFRIILFIAKEPQKLDRQKNI